MRVVIFFCISSLVVAATLAAVAIIPPDNTPGHPGHCYSKDTGPMNKGESKPYTGCAKATCNADGSIGLESCGVAVIHGDCSKVKKYEDVKDKPYPGCCVPKCIPA